MSQRQESNYNSKYKQHDFKLEFRFNIFLTQSAKTNIDFSKNPSDDSLVSYVWIKNIIRQELGV